MPRRPERQEKQLNNKPLAILSPLCLALYATGAHAALEPFSFKASETIKHESNVNHAQDQSKRADWISNTELTAALTPNDPIDRTPSVRFQTIWSVNP